MVTNEPQLRAFIIDVRKSRRRRPLRDIRAVVDHLKEERTFIRTPGRQGFPGFENIRHNLMWDESCEVSNTTILTH